MLSTPEYYTQKRAGHNPPEIDKTRPFGYARGMKHSAVSPDNEPVQPAGQSRPNTPKAPATSNQPSKPGKPPRPSKAIQLLALDLDDTLLQDDLTISERDKNAILAAEHAGVQVLLASGRVREAMEYYAEELGMQERPGFMISGNGTLVTRSDGGEEIMRACLETELAVAAYRVIEEAKLPAEVYIDDTACASRDSYWVDEDCRFSRLKKRIVPEFEELLRSIPVSKMLIPGDPEQLARLKPRLEQEFGGRFDTVISKPFFLEILPKDVDKGSALRRLAEQLGIARERVMAIGDAMNDAGMLGFAGIGVAPANAVPELKALADWVTAADNQNGAVAEAIHTFITTHARA